MSMQLLDLRRLRPSLILWLPVLGVVLFVLNNTTPDRIGPQGVTIFFAVLYVFFSLSINLVSLSLIHISKRKKWRHLWRPLYSFVYGFIPTTALALQSLDQLILRDVLIFVGLAVLIAFYITKRPRSN